MYGSFRNRLPEEVGRTVFAGTKWCVFRPLDGPLTTDFVLAAVKERSRRLGGRVELLQVMKLLSFSSAMTPYSSWINFPVFIGST